MNLRRGENEHRVLGRLFQRFQKRVERLRRKHMHFVDYIDFIFSAHGRILYFFADFSDVFDLVVGRGVHFEDVEIRAVRKGFARLALAARRTVDGRKTIYRPREDLRRGSFARSSRPAEQIGVTYSARVYLIHERSHNMVLSDKPVETAWTESSV